MQSLTLDNVGPIDHLEIPSPEGGGVVVLRGRNGCGKSHALNATRRLLGAKDKPPVSDDAKSASVAGWGAKVKIGSRVTASGELEASTIEGRFDLATLVDPGLQDVDAADVRRIRALLSLSEAEADLARFALEDLGEAEVLYDIDQSADDDLVSLAGKVKRALEQRARKEEKKSSKLEGEARGLRTDLEGIDLREDPDVDGKQAELEQALDRRSKLLQQDETARKQANAREKAQADLKRIGDADVPGARLRTSKAKQLVEHLEEEKRKIEASLQEAQSELKSAAKSLEDEQRKEEAISLARNVLESQTSGRPDPADVELAEHAVKAAREGVEEALVQKRARDKVKRAMEIEEQARRACKQAERLREAARATDDVLSSAVADLGVPLSVRKGRLVTHYDGRGVVPFAELSHGERWSMAISLAVRRVGRGGVLALPQESWEGLDPDARSIVASAARRYEVVILTAEASDGELVAEEYR